MNIEIEKLEQEIAEKSLRLENLKQDKIKTLNKSKDFIKALEQEFESSSQTTQQFLNFYRLFKKDFGNILKQVGAEKIEFSKGHFFISGFFTFKNQAYYFDLDDLRWNTTFLIRTAEHYKDYTGGSNDYLNLDNRESFILGLKRVIKTN